MAEVESRGQETGGESELLALIGRLEALVGRVSSQLRAARVENQQAHKRLAEQGAREQADAAWRSERGQLVERVEQLVIGLDDLVAVAGGDPE